MRYFFLIYALLGLLFLLILPNRFGKFSETEWRLFPDMDEQDKAMPQRPSHFFADGRAARTPDKNLVPMGFAPLNEETRDQLPEFGFGHRDATSYVFTGKSEDGSWGAGIPQELGLDSLEDTRQFLAQGKERYEINCAACHGISANGNGVVKERAVVFSAIPTLVGTILPDGNIYEVMTNGRGLMRGFKDRLSIRDRWAIISYIRSLQDADKASKEAQ